MLLHSPNPGKSLKKFQIPSHRYVLIVDNPKTSDVAPLVTPVLPLPAPGDAFLKLP
jgi:hypothetical protein